MSPDEHLDVLGRSGDTMHVLFHGSDQVKQYKLASKLISMLFHVDTSIMQQPLAGLFSAQLSSAKSTTSSCKSSELLARCSKVHIELDARFITATHMVKTALKTLCQTTKLVFRSRATNPANAPAGTPCEPQPPLYKILLIINGECLPVKVQHALRCLMERNTATCRVIITCNNPCSIIQAIQSRCLCFACPVDNFKQPEQIAEQIAEHQLWQSFVKDMAKDVFKASLTSLKALQPQHLQHFRQSLAELLLQYVDAKHVLEALTVGLMEEASNYKNKKHVTDACLHVCIANIIGFAVACDQRCRQTREGNTQDALLLVHLVSFVANVMACIHDSLSIKTPKHQSTKAPKR